MEKIICGVVSTGTVGVTAEISTVGESTWPWANIVVAHWCAALCASSWSSSCNAGQTTIASNSRTRPASNEAMTAWLCRLK